MSTRCLDLRAIRAAAARLTRAALLAAVLPYGAAPTVAEDRVSFRNEVQAVLSKAGCNQGTCHGNANGKGGFKLSLRGEDPEFDLAALTRQAAGRRVNVAEPSASLILLKATSQVAHEGGRRFGADSEEYARLLGWIAAGAGDDPAQSARLVRLEVMPREQYVTAPETATAIRVAAHYSDGRQRDVTRWAVYTSSSAAVQVSAEGRVTADGPAEATVVVRFLDRVAPVRLAFVAQRPGFVWGGAPENNYVDRHVFARLRKLRINPSELAPDHVFLRRAYLDLLGVPPTGDEARRFAADTGADKRARLVDALLERPEFADHWALKWSDLLRNEEKTLDRKGVQNFHRWIRWNIEAGRPLNEFVRELIAARGSTYTQPATNFYRANRDPVSRGEATAQLFLGVRLQCAKCHNHPFDRWTQDDYYGWTALFARVDYKIVSNNRRDRNNKYEFDGEQIVYVPSSGEVVNPRTDAAAAPRFLGEETTALATDEDRLAALAKWLTAPDNRWFARTQANRIWYQVMGRGIVDPIDDFRDTNPASNPELLEALADDLRGSGFDLRHVLRAILGSRTYQLSAVPNETNADDTTNFSRAMVRPLPAESLLDAVVQASGAAARFSGFPEGMRAGQLPGVPAPRNRDEAAAEGDRFLTRFGKPPRLLSCECERPSDTTLAQVFQMISGPLVNELIGRADNRIGRLMESGADDGRIVEELYWTALGRQPTEQEQQAAAALVDGSSSRRAALEDVLWSLINAKEFLLRQ